MIEVGAGDTLVVLVHGVLDRGGSFRRVARLLEGECRLRAYDRRGYGASQLDGAQPPDIAGHAADALAVFEGEPGVLVGHSFGGVIALAAAAMGSQLVRSVAAYECVLPWAPGWDDSVVQGVLGAPDPEGAALDLMTGTVDDRRRPEARAFVVEERDNRSKPPPFDLRDIRCPVLYATGGLPQLQPMVELMEREVADVEIAIIPGADHHAHRTAPDAFADLVRRAIARSGG